VGRGSNAPGGVFWLIAFWRNPRFAVSEKSKTLGESL